MMEFQIPKIVHEEVDDNRGVFVIEPLDRGFGYTFGNSLRRVLLSSLEGAAVTSVKIEGVAHEFTTLPGVREDVTDIILNLKNLICRLHGESPEIEVRLAQEGRRRGQGLRHRGAGRPRDPQPGPRDREPLRQGQARADADDRPRPRLRPGRAEPRARAHDRRHPDRLDLLAGAARLVRRRGRPRRPAHRLRQAAPRRHHRRLDRPARGDRPGGRDPDPPARDLHRHREDRGLRRGGRRRGGGAEPSLAHGMENFPIEELELGVRSYNCLKRVGIETIGDLVTKSENELAAIPNFGKKSIEEVKETLATHGLRTCAARTGRRRVRHHRVRQEAGPRRLAPQGALREPRGRADRARPDQDDRGEGEGGQADRRADDHARPARRPARAPAGARLPALAGRRAQALRRRRARASPTGPAATRGSSSIGPRPGDAAEMVYLELVDFLPEPPRERPARREREEEPVEAEAAS